MNLNKELLILDIISKISVLKNIDIELRTFKDIDDVKNLLQGVSLISSDIDKLAKKLLRKSYK